MYSIKEVRLHCRGGLKKFSISSAAPAILIPLAFAVAAINEYITIVIFTSISTLLAYIYYYKRARSRFFCWWTVWSMVYITLFFELTVPPLELLPEENVILVVFAIGAFYCLWRANSLATLNYVVPIHCDALANDSVPDSDNSYKNLTSEISQPLCKYCHKNIFTEHCCMCSSFVLKRQHHSYWLDCCIGDWNYRQYIFGLILTELALLLGTNLVLTAICQPFLVLRFGGAQIMLPESCSGVYDDYKLSVAFVTALYAIIIAALIFLVLVCQLCYLFRAANKLDHEENIL